VGVNNLEGKRKNGKMKEKKIYLYFTRVFKIFLILLILTVKLIVKK